MEYLLREKLERLVQSEIEARVARMHQVSLFFALAEIQTLVQCYYAGEPPTYTPIHEVSRGCTFRAIARAIEIVSVVHCTRYDRRWHFRNIVGVPVEARLLLLYEFCASFGASSSGHMLRFAFCCRTTVFVSREYNRYQGV